MGIGRMSSVLAAGKHGSHATAHAASSIAVPPRYFASGLIPGVWCLPVLSLRKTAGDAPLSACAGSRRTPSAAGNDHGHGIADLRPHFGHEVERLLEIGEGERIGPAGLLEGVCHRGDVPYAFPVAAITLASFRYHHATGVDFFEWTGAAFLLVLVRITVLVAIRTLRAARAGEFCVAEES